MKWTLSGGKGSEVPEVCSNFLRDASRDWGRRRHFLSRDTAYHTVLTCMRMRLILQALILSHLIPRYLGFCPFIPCLSASFKGSFTTIHLNFLLWSLCCSPSTPCKLNCHDSSFPMVSSTVKYHQKKLLLGVMGLPVVFVCMVGQAANSPPFFHLETVTGRILW